MGDPRIRLAVNFYGAPAMTRAEFRSYEQRTIIGASVSVGIPVGRYVENRVINVGTNRWSVEAQLGVSHKVRRWTFETGLGFAWFVARDWRRAHPARLSAMRASRHLSRLPPLLGPKVS